MLSLFIDINITIVFCCIAAWIQPDISGCQQDFLVVWRWNQLRTFLGIFENNFTDFREAVSLEKIFEIVQENTLKCSKLISFSGNKKSSLNQCQARSCYYATGCFVAFLGDFFEPKKDHKSKKDHKETTSPKKTTKWPQV